MNKIKNKIKRKLIDSDTIRQRSCTSGLEPNTCQHSNTAKCMSIIL